MKILLPCPACQHPLLPPRQASQSAVLSCPQCGHRLTADSILVDENQLDGSWQVVEDAGSDNFFAGFYQLESKHADALTGDGFGVRDVADVVPPSNEWETQPSSVVLEEPLEREAAYQIAGEFQASDVALRNGTAEFESESMPDEMIGVSDEPWLSQMEHVQEEIGEIEFQHDDDFETQQEDPILFDEGISESLDEPLSVEVEEDNDLELIDSFEENEQSVEPMSLKSSRKATLPTELLGNSQSVLRSRKKSNPVGMLVSVIGGGLAAIPISILLMWYALGKDPLEAGPMVAAFAPWLVPESFRGSRPAAEEKLPEMPPMVGPVFSDLDPDAPRKLPSIGGLPEAATVEEPVIEPAKELAVSPDVSPPSDGPVMAPATNITVGPAIDTTDLPTLENLALPSVEQPELPQPGLDLPKMPAISEDITRTRPSVESIESETPSELPKGDSTIERSLMELEKAIQIFDPMAVETGAILYRALESFGEQLATLPESSPEQAEWREKGIKVCRAILASDTILPGIATFLTNTNGSTALFPGEASGLRGTSVKVDFVKVGSVEKKEEYDMWAIENRLQKESLAGRPLLVPHSLSVSAAPGGRFLILGVSEVEPESRQLVLRTLLAIERE